jgi:hypothetical protein
MKRYTHHVAAGGHQTGWHRGQRPEAANYVCVSPQSSKSLTLIGFDMQMKGPWSMRQVRARCATRVTQVGGNLNFSYDNEWESRDGLTESAIAAQQVALVGVDDAVGSAHRIVLLGTETRTRAGHFPLGSYTCCRVPIQWMNELNFVDILFN